MLSTRSAQTSAELSIPWRFSPGPRQLYHPQKNPSGIVSFALAENSLVHDELADFANKVHIPPDAFTYGYSWSAVNEFAMAFSHHINQSFHPIKPLTGEEIIPTNSATTLHNMLAFTLAEPGDGILLGRPCYGRFELDFGVLSNVKVVYADTPTNTAFEPSAVKYYEEALVRSKAQGVAIKALYVVNPHNPTGRCYQRNTIIELLKFCQKHQIHYISDEIYGLSEFESGEEDAVPFTSVLSIDINGIIDENFVHVEYGTAKDYAAAGLRLGVLITKNQALKTAMKSIGLFFHPSGMTTAVATAMFKDQEWCQSHLALCRKRIAEAYQFVTKGLQRLGVKYLGGANTGFFVYVDLSPHLPPATPLNSPQDREFALAQKLLDQGLFLHPGEQHGMELGWFRLVYTHDRQVVEEGLRRLSTALDSINW